jgi:hypothetical protein
MTKFIYNVIFISITGLRIDAENFFTLIKMESEMKFLILCILSLLLVNCRAKHIEPIKWQKPGDELVGEWLWTKRIEYNNGKRNEITNLGILYNTPGLKASQTAIFQSNGTAQMIYESYSRLDTAHAVWTINGDTLKITLHKEKRTVISLYKVIGNKLINNFLVGQKVTDEYLRD